MCMAGKVHVDTGSSSSLHCRIWITSSGLEEQRGKWKYRTRTGRELGHGRELVRDLPLGLELEDLVDNFAWGARLSQH